MALKPEEVNVSVEPEKTNDLLKTDEANGSVKSEEAKGSSKGSSGAGGNWPKSKTLEEDAKSEYEIVPHGETGDSFVLSIPMQILSWKPRAIYYPGFATADQCETIIRMAKSTTLYRCKAGVVWRRNSSRVTCHSIGVRTSTDKTGTLDYIERKIERATLIPKTHGQGLFSVRRYEIGQKASSHYDVSGFRNELMASFVLYLSDVEEGGETEFPKENGLKVKPRQGDALIFYSFCPNGKRDKFSLHKGCPVIKGEKWILTKFLNNKPMRTPSSFMFGCFRG